LREVKAPTSLRQKHILISYIYTYIEPQMNLILVSRSTFHTTNWITTSTYDVLRVSNFIHSHVHNYIIKSMYALLYSHIIFAYACTLTYVIKLLAINLDIINF
jgi:hypothetical protein